MLNAAFRRPIGRSITWCYHKNRHQHQQQRQATADGRVTSRQVDCRLLRRRLIRLATRSSVGETSRDLAPAARDGKPPVRRISINDSSRGVAVYSVSRSGGWAEVKITSAWLRSKFDDQLPDCCVMCLANHDNVNFTTCSGYR